MEAIENSLLSGMKVLEITNGPSGSYAGRLLAKSGAEVMKICDAEEKLSLFRDSKKNIIRFSRDEECLQYISECLLSKWDLIIWDSHCNHIYKNVLNAFFEKKSSTEACIGVFIDFPPGIDMEEEHTIQAMAGWMELTGHPDLQPLQVGGYPSSHLVGAHAAAGGLLAILTLQQNKRHIVQIDALTVAVSALEGAYSTFLATGEERKRMGNRHHALAPMVILPCEDGWGFLGAPVDEKWALLESWANLVHNPEWVNEAGRLRECRSLEAELCKWTKTMKREELFHTGQAFRMPFAKVQTLQEVRDCPHLEERKFWEQTDRMRLPWKIQSSPKGNGRFLKAKKTLRILDMTNMWSGPYCTRLFADLGIEVIKVEAPHRPDGIRSKKGSAAPFFKELNRNKYGVTLDLNVMSDRQKFLELVETSDAVVENFSPRVMPNFGLQYEQLCKFQPELVYLSLSAFGQTGPYRDFVGYGPTLEAMSGIAALTHYGDEKPWLPGFSLSDIGAGIHGAFILAASLISRKRYRVGVRIDLSQYEVACQFIGDYFFQDSASKQSENNVQTNNLKKIADENRVRKIVTMDRTSLIGMPWQSEEWKIAINSAPELGEHTKDIIVIT